jgi:hypothetical protein
MKFELKKNVAKKIFHVIYNINKDISYITKTHSQK